MVSRDFTKLLIEFKTFPKNKRKRTFMEISGFSHYENICSNILKFYFDPKNEHGFKDLVLNSLIHVFDKSFNINELDEYVISREFKTINDNRLDIFISTDKYVIGIENKIFHHLHNDLEDYYNTIKSKSSNRKKLICIVLSLNKLTSKGDLERIKSSNFVNITYEQLFNNIKKNIGSYLNPESIEYVKHLSDFIKSIENLTSKTMENKAIWTFFKNNLEAIQELTDSFNEYKKIIYEKVYQLKDALPQQEFAPQADKQWIYKGYCLVHDYTIQGKYRISIDVYSDINGWEIQLFGRDSQSSEYLFKIMCIDNQFLPAPLDSYECNERIILQKFNTEIEVSIVANTLADLLSRIEKYKSRLIEITADN